MGWKGLVQLLILMVKHLDEVLFSLLFLGRAQLVLDSLLWKAQDSVEAKQGFMSRTLLTEDLPKRFLISSV